MKKYRRNKALSLKYDQLKIDDFVDNNIALEEDLKEGSSSEGESADDGISSDEDVPDEVDEETRKK